jgi:hypothetical protein
MAKLEKARAMATDLFTLDAEGIRALAHRLAQPVLDADLGIGVQFLIDLEEVLLEMQAGVKAQLAVPPPEDISPRPARFQPSQGIASQTGTALLVRDEDRLLAYTDQFDAHPRVIDLPKGTGLYYTRGAIQEWDRVELKVPTAVSYVPVVVRDFFLAKWSLDDPPKLHNSPITVQINARFNEQEFRRRLGEFLNRSALSGWADTSKERKDDTA